MAGTDLTTAPPDGPAERFLAGLDADGLRPLRANRVWCDADLGAVVTAEAPFVSVGGGLASFTLVDMLRSNAVPTADIRVVAPEASPMDGFRYLARTSQIADSDRLRSDSSARPDNVWGFPGYALEESMSRRSLGPLWKVFAEPVGSEYFTPLSRHVYDGAEREADANRLVRDGGAGSRGAGPTTPRGRVLHPCRR